MKVIFLDINGVLDSYDGMVNYRKANNISHTLWYDNVEEDKIKLLKQLIIKTNAKIVLTSSLRFNIKFIQKLLKIFKENELEIYDATKCIEDNRGMEINDWLKNTKDDIESFIILDDETYQINEELRKYLIQTTYEHGLQQEHVDSGISILNNPTLKRFKFTEK